MSEEVKRYELRIVDRYAGDGTGDIETDARMKQEAKGRYVLFSDYDALLAERDALAKDAERYRWLRNPDQSVSLVLDKMTGEIPADKFGCGGYRTYEYRAGAELDDAIDAALQGEQP